MNLREGIAPEMTALCAAAGLHFRKPDEAGELFPADREFLDEMVPRGLDWILANICGLDAAQALDAAAMEHVRAAADRIAQARAAGKSVLAKATD
jgi:hypothetical protein